MPKYKLKKRLLLDALLIDLPGPRSHERKRLGNFWLNCRRCPFTLQVNSLDASRVRNDDAGSRAPIHCNATSVQRVTLANGERLTTNSLLVGEFNVLPVPSFAFEGKRRFAFAQNSKLPRSTCSRYHPYQKPFLLRISMTITLLLAAFHYATYRLCVIRRSKNSDLDRHWRLLINTKIEIVLDTAGSGACHHEQVLPAQPQVCIFLNYLHMSHRWRMGAPFVSPLRHKRFFGMQDPVRVFVSSKRKSEYGGVVFRAGSGFLEIRMVFTEGHMCSCHCQMRWGAAKQLFRLWPVKHNTAATTILVWKRTAVDASVSSRRQNLVISLGDVSPETPLTMVTSGIFDPISTRSENTVSNTSAFVATYAPNTRVGVLMLLGAISPRLRTASFKSNKVECGGRMSSVSSQRRLSSGSEWVNRKSNRTTNDRRQRGLFPVCFGAQVRIIFQRKTPEEANGLLRWLHAFSGIRSHRRSSPYTQGTACEEFRRPMADLGQGENGVYQSLKLIAQ